MRLLRVLAPAAAALSIITAITAIAGPAYAEPTGAPTAPAATGHTKPGQLNTPPLPADEAARLARQERLMPAAQDLITQAGAAASDIGGVSIDVDAGTVHVYRTDPTKAARLTTGEVPADVRVQVHTAKFSRAAMLRTAGQIKSDARVLSDEQTLVQGVGPTPDGSGVTVTVFGDPADSAAADRAATVLRRHYGDTIGAVNVVPHPVADSKLYFDGFRFNDFAPWFGGDRITDGSVGCSTGFAAQFNSKPVMLTAGHCGDLGTTWFNGPRTDNSMKVMGSTVFDDDSTDIAAISVTSASTFINVGSATAPTQMNATSWASPVVGQLVCQSGSFTGETCGLKVVDTGQSQCKAWFIFCVSWYEPLADVINTKGSGAFAAGHGDSGGPVYVRGASTVTAVGLVHGQLSDTAAANFPAFFPDTLNCPSPSGTSPRCSSGFSFAHMPGR